MVLGPNLLSTNDSSFDTDVSGWSVGFNCTLARVTANFRSTPACMQMNCTSGASGVSNCSKQVAVTAANDYTWAINSRLATTTGKLGRCMIEFTDSGGTTIGVRHDSADVSQGTSYLPNSINFLAPAGAVNAYLVMECELTVTNEKWLMDDLYFGLTNVTVPFVGWGVPIG